MKYWNLALVLWSAASFAGGPTIPPKSAAAAAPKQHDPQAAKQPEAGAATVEAAVQRVEQLGGTDGRLVAACGSGFSRDRA